MITKMTIILKVKKNKIKNDAVPKRFLLSTNKNKIVQLLHNNTQQHRILGTLGLVCFDDSVPGLQSDTEAVCSFQNDIAL